MAITYKSQGSGVATETSAAALSPLCPATVDAGDILIAHVFWEGTATAPSTPSTWTLLSGPHVIQTTIARHWVFGKIASGSEDGAAVAFGAPAVTTQRAARVYSFAGRISGTIGELVIGFAPTSNATDPAMPTVVTTRTGSLAVALVGQNDNNTTGNPTGETGGDWVEGVAEFSANLTPGLTLAIETCTPTGNPGTVTGGTIATTDDPVGVIGFEIKDSNPPGVGALDLTGFAPTFAATNNKNITPDVGALTIAGFSPTVFATDNKNTTPSFGELTINGFAPTFSQGVIKSPGLGEIALSGFEPTLNITNNLNLSPDVGSITLNGLSPTVETPRVIISDTGLISITGFNPSFTTSDNKSVSPDFGQITVTGFSPLAGSDITLLPQTGALSLNGFSPTLNITVSANVQTGELNIQGFSPSIQTPLNINPQSGSVIITGFAPVMGNAIVVEPFTGLIDVNGFAPQVIIPVILITGSAVIEINTFAPLVGVSSLSQSQTGEISIIGFAPSFGESEPIVVDSTVWIKFGKFSIMPCDPCAPKFIVSCLTDEPTDDFEFNIYGLANGVYYWRITEASTILTKAFNHVEGNPLSIAVSDVPDGFFTTKRTFLFEILKTASSENPIPFLIGQYVEQLSIDIECNIYPSNTVGEDTTP